MRVTKLFYIYIYVYNNVDDTRAGFRVKFLRRSRGDACPVSFSKRREMREREELLADDNTMYSTSFIGDINK